MKRSSHCPFWKDVLYIFSCFLFVDKIDKCSDPMWMLCALGMLMRKASIDMQMWLPMQSYKDANGKYLWCKCPYEDVSIDFHDSWCKCFYREADVYFYTNAFYQDANVFLQDTKANFEFMLQMLYSKIHIQIFCCDANTCEHDINQMFFQIKALWCPKSRFWETQFILSMGHLSFR